MNSAELKDKLIADFYANEARINGEGKTAFHQTRKAALQSFEHLGFPTIKHEESGVTRDTPTSLSDNNSGSGCISLSTINDSNAKDS